jgi:hypothetical protein
LSCAKKEEFGTLSLMRTLLRLLLICLTACLPTEKGSKVQALMDDSEFATFKKEYRRYFGQELITKLSEMKMNGESLFQPYSGYWYPEHSRAPRGGSNVYGTLDKYDKAFARSSASWEQENHTITDPNSPQAKWYGHCTGFASAAVRHPEPARSVTHNDVVFSPEDIKALLAEVYMSPEFIILGGNKCEEHGAKKPRSMRPNQQKLEACEDINPASLHLALTNVLGQENAFPFVTERSRDAQVWNYPTFKYECVNCINQSWPQEITRTQAAALLGEREYRFTREDAKFYNIQMRVYFVESLRERELLNQTQATSTETYTYVLETDADGHIIGGEWYGQSYQKHPDFLWLPIGVSPGNGEKEFANPHVKFDDVFFLARQSTSQPFDLGIQGNEQTLTTHAHAVTFNGEALRITTSPVRIELKSLATPTATQVLINQETIRVSSDATISADTDLPSGIHVLKIETSSSEGKQSSDLVFRVL